VKREAETLTLDYIQIYGGEKFKSFIAQDISVLHQHYPRLLLDAQTTVDNENKRKEQKKRKLEDDESAGASSIDSRAAGESAVSLPLRECQPVQVLDDKRVIEPYLKRIESLKKQKRDLETAVAGLKFDLDFVQVRARESRAQNEELKQEIAKLKGQNLNLPEDELRELLGDVTYAFGKISDTVHLGEVKTELERRYKFCCPISSGVFIEPVAGPDGYVYERNEIEEWIRRQLYSHQHTNLEGQWKSPSTPEYFTSTALPPAIFVKSLMSEEIEKNLIKMRVKQVSR
jgi:hypothetical protein